MKLPPYEVPEGDRDLLDCGRVIDPLDRARFPAADPRDAPRRPCGCPGCPDFVPRGSPKFRRYCRQFCAHKAARLRREARDAAGVPRQPLPDRWRKAAATVAGAPLPFSPFASNWPHGGSSGLVEPPRFGQTLGDMFPLDYARDDDSPWEKDK